MTIKLVKIVRVSPDCSKWFKQNLNETFHVLDDGGDGYAVIWPAFERRNQRRIPKNLCKIVDNEEEEDGHINPVARHYLGEWAQSFEGE